MRELQDIGIRSYLPHCTHLWKEGGVDWYMRRCFADEVLQKNVNIGYDAHAGEYADMYKAGVIDPVKVVRTALANAS